MSKFECPTCGALFKTDSETVIEAIGAMYEELAYIKETTPQIFVECACGSDLSVDVKNNIEFMEVTVL